MDGRELEQAAGESAAVRGAAVAMESMAAWYTDTSSARALVSLIPGVGGALDALIAGEGARIEKRRLDKLLTDLRLDLALVDAAKLDAEYIQSESFFDWVVLLFERAVRTGDDEKVRAYRRVFVQGLTREYNRGSLKEIILRHVGDMTGVHIAVLRWIVERTHKRLCNRLAPPDVEGTVTPVELEELRSSLEGVSPEEVDAVVIDLVTTAIVDYHPPFGSWDVDRKHVLVTQFGWSLVAFLREP